MCILMLCGGGCEPGVYLYVQVEVAVDQVREKLLQVQGGEEKLEEKEKSELKKRKLLSEVYEPTLSIFILHIIDIFIWLL